MAGHSKWANIKHKKAAQDKKRGKIFTKLIKEITVAAKIGGPDPDANPRLRAAITNGKKQSLPKDNIEKAIKKASSKDDGSYTELTYEGYAPDGVAIFIEAATDNQTRTVSNIRSYFNKNGGSLGKDGCLQFIFDRKAVFELQVNDNIKEEEFMLEMIDAGAEDVVFESQQVIVTGAMEDFGSLQKKFEELKLEPEESSLQRIPTTFKDISKENFEKIMKLIDILEDDDDIQKVYHNIQFDESFIHE